MKQSLNFPVALDAIQKKTFGTSQLETTFCFFLSTEQVVIFFLCTWGSPPSQPSPFSRPDPFWPCSCWGGGGGPGLVVKPGWGAAVFGAQLSWKLDLLHGGNLQQGNETRQEALSVPSASAHKQKTYWCAAAAAYLLIRGGVHHDVLLLPVSCNDPSRQWGRWGKRGKQVIGNMHMFLQLGRLSSGEKISLHLKAHCVCLKAWFTFSTLAKAEQKNYKKTQNKTKNLKTTSQRVLTAERHCPHLLKLSSVSSSPRPSPTVTPGIPFSPFIAWKTVEGGWCVNSCSWEAD